MPWCGAVRAVRAGGTASGPSFGRLVRTVTACMPAQSAERAERPRRHLLQADDRRAGRPAISSIISRRCARRPGGTVLPWKRFQVRTSIGALLYETVRVVIADPPAYTPWYDHELAAGARARRAPTVEVATSRFRFAELPAAGRLPAHRALLSALVAPLPPLARAAAAEGASSTSASPARFARLRADVLHVQWLALPQVDVARALPLARRSSPRTTCCRGGRPRSASSGSGCSARFDRVVVHTRARPRDAARPRRRGARDPASRLPERGRRAPTTGRRCSRSA